LQWDIPLKIWLPRLACAWMGRTERFAVMQSKEASSQRRGLAPLTFRCGPLLPQAAGVFSCGALRNCPGDSRNRPRRLFMIGNPLHFADLMLDAQRAAVALEGIIGRSNGSRAATAAVKEGKRVCSKLVDYQRTVWMTKSEAAMLQTALDLLQGRLQFLGEAV
jgi:hypothetical protein